MHCAQASGEVPGSGGAVDGGGSGDGKVGDGVDGGVGGGGCHSNVGAGNDAAAHEKEQATYGQRAQRRHIPNKRLKVPSR